MDNTIRSLISKHASGRPSKYSEEMLSKAQGYFLRCYGKMDGKQRIPFIEELALELEVDEDTIVEWKNKKNDDGSLIYPEFSATYSRILLLQKFRLKQNGLKGKNQSFVQFLLNANHGMISAEKQILAGDRQEPLEIVITEERPLPV